MSTSLDFKISSLRSQANWDRYQLQSAGIRVQSNISDWEQLKIHPIGMGGLPIKPTAAEARYYKYAALRHGKTIPNLDMYIDYLDKSNRLDVLRTFHPSKVVTNRDYLEAQTGKVHKVISNYESAVRGAGFDTPLFTHFTFQQEYACLPYLLATHTAQRGTPIWDKGFSNVWPKIDAYLTQTNSELFTVVPTDDPVVYKFDTLFLNIPPSKVPVILDHAKHAGPGIVHPEVHQYAFIASKLCRAVESGKASPDEITEYNRLMNLILNGDYDSLANEPMVLLKEFSVPPKKTVSNHKWYFYIDSHDITSVMVSGTISVRLQALTQVLMTLQGYLPNQALTSNLDSNETLILPTDSRNLYYAVQVISEPSDYAPEMITLDGLKYDIPEDTDKLGILPIIRETLTSGHSEFEVPYGTDYNEYIKDVLSTLSVLFNNKAEYTLVNATRNVM